MATLTHLTPSFIINNGLLDQFGYKVTLIKATNKSQAELGVTNYFRQFAIYESLFSKFMYVEGNIYDGGGIAQKIGFQAGDILRFTLFKDESDTKTEMIIKDFYIESIGGQKRNPNQKGASYTFLAVSKCGKEASSTTIKRSYNKKGKDIIMDICTQVLQLTPEEMSFNTFSNTSGLTPTANFEDTYGDISLIMPSVPPFEAIEFVLQQCISNTDKIAGNNFFFYETRDGVILRALKTIVASGKTHEYRMPVDKNRSKDGPDQDYLSTQSVHHAKSNNQRENLNQGILENQTLSFDFISRSITKQSFNLKEDHKGILLMGEYLLLDSDEIENYTGSQRVTDEQQSLFVRCSNKSYDKAEDYYELAGGTTRAQIQLLNQTQITIKILGNPKIKPGDTINLKVAQPDNELLEDRDPILGGKYLVASCKHVVSDAIDYITLVDLFKDGYERDVGAYRKDTHSHFIKEKV